jgi:hypothetical protein
MAGAWGSNRPAKSAQRQDRMKKALIRDEGKKQHEDRATTAIVLALCLEEQDGCYGPMDE